MYDLLVKASAARAVAGNLEGSYLTLKSDSGLMLVSCSFALMGTVYLDQRSWQRAIASRPTTAVRGYIMRGVRHSLRICKYLGLAAVALTDNPAFPTYPSPMSSSQVSAGLSAPFGCVAILGKQGSIARLLTLFMAVTLSPSSKLIAMSSILTFDVYKTYIKPSATPEQLIRPKPESLPISGALGGLSAGIIAWLATLHVYFGEVTVASNDTIHSCRYEIPVVYKTQDDFSMTAKCTFGKPGDPGLEDWNHQRGPYLSNGLIFGIVKKSSQADFDPDLFIFGGPTFFRGYYPGYSELTTSDKRHFTWAVLKAHTHNQDGTVMLTSADPRDVPDIDFNNFSTTSGETQTAEQDLGAIAEGLVFAHRIMDDVIPVATGPLEEVSPGRHLASTEQVKEFIKNEAWGHHASCSCPIGADGDPKAVLDSRFRVRGVSNLRVVDASVFPRIPGFFIVIPIYMVSEKATDVILEDIGGSSHV
ncbi:GMC oxidoreductase-domain-containing protein [Lipomyces mesembrius]